MGERGRRQGGERGGREEEKEEVERRTRGEARMEEAKRYRRERVMFLRAINIGGY